MLAASGAVLSAVYMLWMYQRVFWGETSDANRNMPDLDRREKIILVPALALMVIMGVFSPFFLRRLDATIASVSSKTGGPERHVKLRPQSAGFPVAAKTQNTPSPKFPLALRSDAALSNKTEGFVATPK